MRMLMPHLLSTWICHSSQSHPFPWGRDKSYIVKAFNVTIAEAFSPFLADYVCHGVRKQPTYTGCNIYTLCGT